MRAARPGPPTIGRLLLTVRRWFDCYLLEALSWAGLICNPKPAPAGVYEEACEQRPRAETARAA